MAFDTEYRQYRPVPKPTGRSKHVKGFKGLADGATPELASAQSVDGAGASTAKGDVELVRSQRSCRLDAHPNQGQAGVDLRML